MHHGWPYSTLGDCQYGDTALHDAARNGHLPVVKALVAAGADVNGANHMGKSPLEAAKAAGNRAAVVEFLEMKQKRGGPAAGARYL